MNTEFDKINTLHKNNFYSKTPNIKTKIPFKGIILIFEKFVIRQIDIIDITNKLFCIEASCVKNALTFVKSKKKKISACVRASVLNSKVIQSDTKALILQFVGLLGTHKMKLE